MAEPWPPCIKSKHLQGHAVPCLPAAHAASTAKSRLPLIIPLEQQTWHLNRPFYSIFYDTRLPDMLAKRHEAALALHWTFSCISIFIMAARLLWRRRVRQSYNSGDYLTVLAISLVLVRLALDHVVLVWGTANMPPEFREEHTFTSEEIDQRIIGSQLDLANRINYSTYLWTQKLVLFDLLRRLIQDLPFHDLVSRTYVLAFTSSYIAVLVTTLAECSPIKLNWQVFPDPGDCIEAQLSLLTLGILNIVTDVMLLILPIPILAMLRVSWRRKAQLYGLFAIGTLIVVITVVRLPINAAHKHSNANRCAWLSAELFTVTVAVNAPALYGLWNLSRRQRLQSCGMNQGHNIPRNLQLGSVITTIGGTETYKMAKRREPPGCIVQTTEVVISHAPDGEAMKSKEQSPLSVILDGASSHSTQTDAWDV
ncbi:PTH11-type GPCR protein [Purpureocillium lilacinum]|nr:PTH11-type GPCR protein [Purpureocillium lilacinum]